MDSFKIVIGIPGKWKSFEEFKNSITHQTSNYIYIGQQLVSTINKEISYHIEISEKNPDIIAAMEYGGRGLLNQDDLDMIENHQMIVYIIGEGGSMEKVHNIMDATSAILNAGGLGVNVESSGRASSKSNWIDITATKELQKVWALFIQMDKEDNIFYTIGMHSFGYRDLVISADSITPSEVATLFRIFCLYNLDESPQIQDKETFSLGPQYPVYLLEKEECKMFDQEDPFYNPFGMWKMTLMHVPQTKS